MGETATLLRASAYCAGDGRGIRVAHVSDHLAGTVTALAAAALAAGTLVAFALTRRPGGLFNFQERGLQPSPHLGKQLGTVLAYFFRGALGVQDLFEECQ